MKNKQKFTEFIEDNQIVIITVVIYVFGLIAGSICYYSIDSESLKSLADELLSFKNKTFIEQFSNDLCLYFSLFAMTLVFGMCSLGTPIVALIPFFTGLINAVKISYFYSNYGIKGIGYTLLMILPGASLFVAVQIVTVCNSIEMSRVLFKASFKEGSFSNSLSKTYLKEFAVYAIIVILISLLNSLLTTAVSSIISL